MPGRHQPRLDRTRDRVRNQLDEQHARDAAPPDLPDDDAVDLASAQSMDASDPPSFTPIKTGGTRHPASADRK